MPITQFTLATYSTRRTIITWRWDETEAIERDTIDYVPQNYVPRLSYASINTDGHVDSTFSKLVCLLIVSRKLIKEIAASA